MKIYNADVFYDEDAKPINTSDYVVIQVPDGRAFRLRVGDNDGGIEIMKIQNSDGRLGIGLIVRPCVSNVVEVS